MAGSNTRFSRIYSRFARVTLREGHCRECEKPDLWAGNRFCPDSEAIWPGGSGAAPGDLRGRSGVNGAANPPLPPAGGRCDPGVQHDDPSTWLGEGEGTQEPGRRAIRKPLRESDWGAPAEASLAPSGGFFRRVDFSGETGFHFSARCSKYAPGEVAEWSIAPHSKCGIRATVSGVQIPPSPPPPRKQPGKQRTF